MNSLGLVGDGDDCELLVDFERAFGIKFADDDCIDCVTVGDLEEVVWRHLQAKSYRENRCASAMAFYDLRRAIKDMLPGERILPSTRLDALPVKPSSLRGCINRRNGLKLRLPGTWIGDVSGYAFLACLFGLLPAALHFHSFVLVLLAVFGMAASLFAVGRDPGQWGELQTVGDLAHKVADQNFGVFLDRGGRLNREAVWNAVRSVASTFDGCLTSRIDRDTLIISPGFTWFKRP